MLRTNRATLCLCVLLPALVVSVPAGAREPRVVFLEGDAARAAIVNDASDHYFARLQPLEMAAKTGAALDGDLDAQRAETRRRYRQAILPFSADEQAALHAYVAALAPMFAAYPRYARLPWRFVKVSDAIEGGLPHTRADFIVLSESVATGLTQLRQQLPADAATARAGMLLVHEQMHVLQRLDPGRFASLYTRVFGFVHTGTLVLPPELVTNQVVNPDGSACCWLFPLKHNGGYVLPYLVFGERAGPRRMPQDFRMLAVQVAGDGRSFRVQRDADGRARVEDLAKVADYVAAFPLTQDYYDPNEAAADLFAQLLLYDGLLRARLPAAQGAALERGLAPLRRWCRANLGS